jgi:signal transduction histidine kinase
MRISRSAAYAAAALAIVAEVIFLFVWAGDSRARYAVRAAALFWPVFMVFVAEAMRMSGEPGEAERLRRDLIRLKLEWHRSEDERDRLARKLDGVDHALAPVLLFVLPLLAIAFGIYLWAA